jgi:hypothetical protein
VLFDPREEKLDLPAAFVQVADRQSGLRRQAGQEHEGFPGLGIAETNSPWMRRVISPRVVPVQSDCLIRYDSGRAIGRGGINPVQG